MYFHLKFEEELGENEWRYTRQVVAKMRPGWTMEYIDGLSHQDLIDMMAVEEGISKSRKKD